MSPPEVLFLGGNGHDPVRLEGVRSTLAEVDRPFDILDLRYPAAHSFEALLDQLEERLRRWHVEHPAGLVYATGIGGLIALSLRARGSLLGNRLILQGAVLWGLEQRWFPRLMRLPGLPWLLAKAFSNEHIQRRFVARHFQVEPRPEWSRRFFDGYGDSDAFASWFRWLTPSLLRQLERELPSREGALAEIEAWWGEEETVVGAAELRQTERALGVPIPLRTFGGWGHYPMIDDPQGWVAEVRRVVETAPALS